MLKNLALAIVRPLLATWIKTRALKIPAAKRADAQQRLGVDAATLDALEAMFADNAVAELDKLRF